MPSTEKAPAEHAEIAEKIRSGEFFRESRNIYDIIINDPMAERYVYVLITALAGAILLMAIIAVNGLYPLKASVPFIVSSNNLIEDRPNIRPLISRKGETPSAAVLRFMAQNYVLLREEYDITIFDRNANGVKSQSSDQLFEEYQKLNMPSNPESPIAQYQRHSRRKVNVLFTRLSGDNSMEVTFEAMVIGKTEVKKSHWQATMTFDYTGIALDETTGKVKPFTFTVTGYKVKRLQDIK